MSSKWSIDLSVTRRKKDEAPHVSNHFIKIPNDNSTGFMISWQSSKSQFLYNDRRCVKFLAMARMVSDSRPVTRLCSISSLRDSRWWNDEQDPRDWTFHAFLSVCSEYNRFNGAPMAARNMPSSWLYLSGSRHQMDVPSRSRPNFRSKSGKMLVGKSKESGESTTSVRTVSWFF